MSVAELIAELKRAYEEAGLDCADKLAAPASKAELDVMTCELSLPLPGELGEVYAVHGGQGYVSPGVTGLFGQHRLHPPDEVVRQHRMFCETCLGSGKWDAKLIPFGSWDAYDLCVHAGSGEVWELNPSGGLWCHRPGIGAVLREVLAAVRAGEEPMLREYQEGGGQGPAGAAARA